MPLTAQAQCPAKIHLFHEFAGLRGGKLQTADLVAKISLYDVIDASPAPSGLALEIVDETGGSPGPEAGPRHPALRAAEAFRREFRMGPGVQLRLTKRIPAGGGLGCGDSQAAGVLRALTRLHRLERDASRLRRVRAVGVRLGGYVPFFLSRNPMAGFTGAGRAPRYLTSPRALPWLLLASSGAAPRKRPSGPPLEVPRRESVLTSLSHLGTLKTKLEKGRPISEWAGLLFNRHEESVFRLRPELRQVRELLTRLGLEGARLSGPGDFVFAFASSREEGEAAMKRLRGYPWKVFLACCLG
ncbi:MAG: hypothetical protein A2X36_11845 [Elusimicrobia bacterium GWA2_69_24]|nr:MAG: hypothetical protein A2X36_11845 [Elusimicrobia bacterium GWA2_69_24]HBL16319.1 hypothetical protein [Elusimicrobiota bacterium]